MCVCVRVCFDSYGWLMEQCWVCWASPEAAHQPTTTGVKRIIPNLGPISKHNWGWLYQNIMVMLDFLGPLYWVNHDSLIFQNNPKTILNAPLKDMTLPSRLQHLTLGTTFNQSLEHVKWPSSLQSITFGFQFNQNLEHAVWPNSLRSLTFGPLFKQNLENVKWPSNLQSLTFHSGCGSN